MSSRLGNLIGLVCLMALAVAAISGCEGIKVVPGTSESATGPLAVAEAADAPRHDLAVISLDLDPPLQLLQIDQSQPNVALLAAIDNLGSFTEQQVAVVATLRSQPEDEVLLQRREVVANIAPGQATLVRFTGFPSIPARSAYELTVTVEPVPDEQNLANNSETLPLQLVLSR